MVCFMWGGTKNFCISRELWRLEIRAVEEQRPFRELPWRPRAGLGGVFPGLQPFILGADRGFNLADPSEQRHVHAVALEVDGYTKSLRVEFLRFRAGGRDGRGSRTPITALPGSLTVISVVGEETCARGRRRSPSEPGGGTQGARCDRDGAVREIGAGAGDRDLRFVS